MKRPENRRAEGGNALSVDEALRLLCGLMVPVAETSEVGLAAAAGRVLAEDLLSPIDVPAHDNAAMDGYAFDGAAIAGGRGARLAIVGTALAGHRFERSLAAGEAIRITTGAVMPTGADTVLMQESAQIESDGTILVVPPGERAGQHRRRHGEDLALGACALRAGILLGAASIGLAASLGLASLRVRRPIRVAYFSTGDEVLDVGQPALAGSIYDSNRYTIGTLLRQPGIDLLDLGRVADSTEALAAALDSVSRPGGIDEAAAGRQVDAIITSGGVSTGEADHTRRVFSERGDVAFHRVDMRPGRPLAFGRIGTTAYVGLPGNPVAAMIAFLFIARPALYRLMGASPSPLPLQRVRLGAALRKRHGRTEYARAVLQRAADGHWEATAASEQGSGILRSMHEAHCILVLPPESGDLARGEWVDAVPISSLC